MSDIGPLPSFHLTEWKINGLPHKLNFFESKIKSDRERKKDEEEEEAEKSSNKLFESQNEIEIIYLNFNVNRSLGSIMSFGGIA